MRWKNFFSESLLQPIHPRSKGVYHSARILLVSNIHEQQVSNFLRFILLNPIFFLAHTNTYSEGTNDGQMTPRGYPTFISNDKNLQFLVFQTDRQTETLIGVGWVTYLSRSKT
jgi:hypothetical protein